MCFVRFLIFFLCLQLQTLVERQGTTIGPTAGAAAQPYKERVPCSDDIRILLFARSDREKEDWFRRFSAASVGTVTEQEFLFSDMVMINDSDVAAAMKAVPTTAMPALVDSGPAATAHSLVVSGGSGGQQSATTIAEGAKVVGAVGSSSSTTTTTTATTTAAAAAATTLASTIPSTATATSTTSTVQAGVAGGGVNGSVDATDAGATSSLFEGLLMTSCAARCPADYIKFMSRYQVN